jgi:hypothetical protein
MSDIAHFGGHCPVSDFGSTQRKMQYRLELSWVESWGRGRITFGRFWLRRQDKAKSIGRHDKMGNGDAVICKPREMVRRLSRCRDAVVDEVMGG